MEMRVVVIGYGTAGQTAASFAKKFNENAEVIVIERHQYPIYHPCSLPMVLSGKFSLDELYERKPWPGVDVITGAEAKEIDTEKKVVKYEKNGSYDEIDYDSLVLAMGLKPTFPPVKGMDLEGVGTVWDIESVRKLKIGSKVAVVGGSATGIEVAAELSKTGRKVYLFEMMEQLMPGKVDPTISSLVAKKLTEMGVEVRVKSPLREIIGKERVEGVDVGERIDVDSVIVVTGAKPNSDLARRSGIEVGETGGVKVNERMETNISNVFAAGDVAEVRDLVTGLPTTTGLASTALVQGKVAGCNAVGGSEVYKGALSPFIVTLGDYQFGGVGLTSSQAEKLGVKHETMRIVASDLPKYYKERDKLVLWAVLGEDGRLLGAQLFGRREIRGRLMFLTLAIEMGLRAQDIKKIPIPYHPDLCDINDPISMLSDVFSFVHRAICL
ncbi:MAG: NAD(P)/FAD-dependent oxidoreductase [Candidatus Methanodesulfokora sp.]